MTDSEQFYTGVRQLQATPEQWAAVHRIFGLPLPEAGASMLMVRSPDAMEPGEMGAGATGSTVASSRGPGHLDSACARGMPAALDGIVAELDGAMARDERAS